MKIAAAFTFTTLCFTNLVWAAEYHMTLIETGRRDYYCTITVQIENLSEQALADLNGHFVSFVKGAEVGRSKGASFLNIKPGARALAEFETPDAPCDDITGYRFLVGACRIGTSFVDQDDCAERIQPDAPIMETSAR